MTNKPGEALLAVTQFPSWVLDQTLDLGSLGGVGEPDINEADQSFVVYLCPRDGLFIDHCIISHDGMGVSGNEADTIELSVYRVPKETTIAAAIAAPTDFLLAAPITISAVGAGFIEFDFTAGTAITRRLLRGDRFVLVIGSIVDQGSSSSSSSPSQTTLANVSVSVRGHTQQG